MIVQPPTASASVRVERTRNQPELGIGAIIFASVVTFALLSIGCIWPLPCTIIGIVLGVTVSIGDTIILVWPDMLPKCG